MAIQTVHREAFNQETEATLVNVLRADPRYIRDLSLVAVVNDRVVGHILFFQITIETPSHPFTALSLAPLGVLPAMQHRGIGSALTRHGLVACRHLGHGGVICVGHPSFYPRFGFTPARAAGFDLPFPAPDEAFMVCETIPQALSGVRGVVRYPDAFNAGIQHGCEK